jgi:hypothetical protein
MSGLAFLSWTRHGIATKISVPDAPGATTPRATVPVQLTINSQTVGPAGGLGLVGPAEVAGFDTRTIIRTWPAANATDAEPNYFALIETDQADLPWRYTPASTDVNDRLRPWFCLIVLRDHTDEIAEYTPAGGDRPFGIVKIALGAPMPRSDQTWAWAHVQVSGETTADSGVLKGHFDTAPEKVIARLVCPRHLQANTKYWGMLVPVLEQARLAGLREPLGGATNALAAAWSVDASGSLQGTDAQRLFPVYYRWQFRTGMGGDFESLIRLLEPRDLPASVGLRDMDVEFPGGGLPKAWDTPLPAEGALKGPLTAPPNWTGTTRDAFVAALAATLNKPADARETVGPTPVVAPPLYGQWHAQRRRLNQTPLVNWYQTLNSDPRTRVAAGLGTSVVQANQQQLMASAWNQVGRVRAINDLLRKAQLGRAISQRLYERYLVPLDADALLFFTQPVHGRVLNAVGTKTVRALARNSPPREALFSGAYRRLARPLGAIGRRQSRPDAPPQPVISRVNDQEYIPAKPQPAPLAGTMPTHSWLTSVMGSQAWIPPGPPTAQRIGDAPQRWNMSAWDPEFGDEPSPEQGSQGQDTASMGRYRQSAIAYASRSIGPLPGETLYKLIISELKDRVIDTLDPAVTVPASLKTHIVRATGFTWSPPDPIEPIMAAPEFQQPMYKPLAALSQDWVLPGLKDVPANTATLAVTNQAFIEAYMVGLNHEMARELLWNEYPTDQRGTYFRQFWDPAGFVTDGGPWPPDEATLEGLRDIKKIHTWPTTSPLGQNSPRSSTGQLVLLVRAEVLRRYPNTLIYMSKADVDSNGDFVLKAPEEQIAPVFGGALPPDIRFFGFDIAAATAKGDGGANKGWFFVFQEEASEPKFGLDESGEPSPTSWDDLGWEQLPPNTAYIDLSTAAPNTGGILMPPGVVWHVAEGTRAAHLAYITFQPPVRVLVHASEMLR